MQRIPAHAEDHPMLTHIIEALRSQRTVPDATWAQRRFAMEAMQSQLKLPEGVTAEKLSASGLDAISLTLNSDQDASGNLILYFHGGGYALGSITTHRELMARLAVATGSRVVGVNYRLAPEDPYPAAVDDAVTAYRWLLAQGIDPERIVIAGDSAGGGLSLAALLRLREAGDPLPRAVVLLSPWTDLTISGETVASRADADPMISADALKLMSEAYAKGQSQNPEVSPLCADLSGLPPMLIQVGDAEALLDDSRRLAAAVEEAGGRAELEIFDRMLHVFHAFPQLPEAGTALERIAAFLETVD